MKQHYGYLIFTLFVAFFLAGNSLAGEVAQQHTMKIVVATDGDELLDADVSDLAIGESRSLVTDSGRMIDIIRTADGVELYIDGELQDMGFGTEALHGEHVIVHKDIEVECEADTDGACDHDFVFINADGDAEVSSDGNVTIIEKRIEVVCDENEDCEEMVWISEDGEALHELHDSDAAHKVIRIHKDTGDSDSN